MSTKGLYLGYISPPASGLGHGGLAAAIVLPDGPAGRTEVTWQLTYAGNVRSEGRQASGSLPFRVSAAVVSTSPSRSSATSGSSPTDPSSLSTGPPASPSSSAGAFVVAGDDGDAAWGLLALLIPLGALLWYAARRTPARRVRPRRTITPVIRGYPGPTRVSATSVYDRPLHTVRVTGRRDPAGPRVEARPQTSRSTK